MMIMMMKKKKKKKKRKKYNKKVSPTSHLIDLCENRVLSLEIGQSLAKDMNAIVLHKVVHLVNSSPVA
jgi:hypothetical protein